MSFGIPVACIPVMPNGDIKVDVHLEWINNRQTIEMDMVSPMEQNVAQTEKKKEENIDLVNDTSHLQGVVHSVEDKNDELNNNVLNRGKRDQRLKGTRNEMEMEASIINTNQEVASSPSLSLSPSPSSQLTPVPSQSCLLKFAQNLITPQDTDVLLGRGAQLFSHPGNITLRRLISHYYNEYEKLERAEKPVLAEYIVQVICRSGRFLKKKIADRNVWEEVDTVTARNKVAHAFRTLRASQEQRKKPVNG